MSSWAFLDAVLLAVAMGLAAIVLGKNLTRSLAAAYASVVTTLAVLAWCGAGFLAWAVGMLAVAGLAAIQVVGWMLVDVDRDHLPATDRATRTARSLAFAILGGAFALLVVSILPELDGSDPAPRAVTLASIGETLFGALREQVALTGLLVAACLLATLGLLRQDEES